MWFWVIMLVSNLTVPVLMIVFGWIFQKHPPKQINPLYGYRTKMSMLNTDTWSYAHLYLGKLWMRTGWVSLPLSFLAMMPVYGKGDSDVGITGGIVITIQVMILLLPVVWTERELRSRFDADGRRK